MRKTLQVNVSASAVTFNTLINRGSNGAAKGSVAGEGFFYPTPIVWNTMGFGSYDESEQENQEIDADLDDETVDGAEHDHQGEVEFEFDDADSDELLEQLEDIKE